MSQVVQPQQVKMIEFSGDTLWRRQVARRVAASPPCPGALRPPAQDGVFPVVASHVAAYHPACRSH